MVPHELISQSITDWITGLNYQYMAVVILICYGLKWKANMHWLNDKLGGEVRAKWLVGIVVAITEVVSTFEFLGGHGVGLDMFLLLFHSYLIAMIFCDDIIDKVHNWVMFLGKKGQGEDESGKNN